MGPFEEQDSSKHTAFKHQTYGTLSTTHVAIVMGNGTDKSGDDLKRAEVVSKQWHDMMNHIQNASVSVNSAAEDEGHTSAILYVLAVISERVVKTSTTVSLDVCGISSEDDAGSSGGGDPR